MIGPSSGYDSGAKTSSRVHTGSSQANLEYGKKISQCGYFSYKVDEGKRHICVDLTCIEILWYRTDNGIV